MGQSLDQYANVRPARVLPDIRSPLHAVGRGDSEGEYAGQDGRSHRGRVGKIATEVATFTRAGVEHIMRFGFKTARSRQCKPLTVVAKSNAQRHGMVLWDEITDVS